MPTYVYECFNCPHRFELKQSFQSETVAPCPLCKNETQRVILSVPVVFKGSGWYVNDYGKKSPDPQKTNKPETTTKEKKDSSNTSAKKPKSTNKSASKKEKSGNGNKDK